MTDWNLDQSTSNLYHSGVSPHISPTKIDSSLIRAGIIMLCIVFAPALLALILSLLMQSS